MSRSDSIGRNQNRLQVPVSQLSPDLRRRHLLVDGGLTMAQWEGLEGSLAASASNSVYGQDLLRFTRKGAQGARGDSPPVPGVDVQGPSAVELADEGARRAWLHAAREHLAGARTRMLWSPAGERQGDQQLDRFDMLLVEASAISAQLESLPPEDPEFVQLTGRWIAAQEEMLAVGAQLEVSIRGIGKSMGPIPRDAFQSVDSQERSARSLGRPMGSKSGGVAAPLLISPGTEDARKTLAREIQALSRPHTEALEAYLTAQRVGAEAKPVWLGHPDAPDGKVWVDHNGDGKVSVGETFVPMKMMERQEASESPQPLPPAFQPAEATQQAMWLDRDRDGEVDHGERVMPSALTYKTSI